MQQLRSLVPSVLQAETMEGASQLQLLIQSMIHGLRHQRHQPVVDGDPHQQPTNHHFN
jgi:hypothetical protein